MNTSESRRLAVLVELSLTRRYSAPVDIIRDCLESKYPASMDAYRNDGIYLDETGLIVYDRHNDVFKITERGLDVALGNADAIGVASPRPVR